MDLTGERYLHFHQNECEDLLDNLDLSSRAPLEYFHHDSVPPHNQRQVRKFLGQTFPNTIGLDKMPLLHGDLDHLICQFYISFYGVL